MVDIMENHDKDKITVDDIRQVAEDNLRAIENLPISPETSKNNLDWINNLFQFFLQNISSKDISYDDLDKFFNDIFKHPFLLDANLPAEINAGGNVAIVIYPFKEMRDLKGSRNDPRYRNGYELPLCLIHQSLTKKTARRLNEVLSEMEMLGGLSCYGDDAPTQALLAVIHAAIIQAEYVLYINKMPHLLHSRRLDKVSLSKDKLRTLQKMKISELIDLEYASNDPALSLQDIFDMWDTIKETSFSDQFIREPAENGVLNYRFMPPIIYTYEQIRQSKGRVRIEFAKPIMQSDFQPYRSANKIFEIAEMLGDMDISELGNTIDSMLEYSVGRYEEINVFRKAGDRWSIGFKGKLTVYDNIKGMDYIAYLLQYQHQEFHVLRLMELVEDVVPLEISDILSKMTASELGSQGLYKSVLSSPIEIFDPKTEQALKRRILELEARIEEGLSVNPEENLELEEELKFIKRVYGSSISISGRIRNIDPIIDRARSNITQRINKAADRIGDFNEPLFQHLKAYLRTGTYLTYNPPKPIKWVF